MLSSNLGNLELALAKEKSSAHTQTLNDLDRERDVLISAFIKWLDVMQFFPDAATAAKATQLSHFLDGFGANIAKQTQLAESTILSNIVKGFRDDATRKGYLADLNGTAWIDAIDKANANFIASSAERVSSSSDDSKVLPFSKVRQTATEAYYELISMLESRYKTAAEDKQPVQAYENCIAELNELIKQTNASAEVSHARKATTTITPELPKA